MVALMHWTAMGSLRLERLRIPLIGCWCQAPFVVSGKLLTSLHDRVLNVM